MIGRLKGMVVDRGVDGSCIVEVGGVGYELFIPLGALGRLPDAPEHVELHVHTHVREDALLLFGFATQADRFAFRALLGVSSIGPKLALSILSSLDAGELAMAIATEDRTRFKGISGVGKKTVERIMLDLKDKLPTDGPVSARRAEPPVAAAAGGVADQLLSTLTQLGYRRAEVEPVVRSVCGGERDEPLENLLREALAALR